MQPSRTLELPFRWATLAGRVRVELGVNDDPEALGCGEFARGFPYCRATIEPEAVGYRDALGWVQMVDANFLPGGFHVDTFEPLGPVSHPFAFYGFSPTLFDAPHAEGDDLDFSAHTFLCGLGGELLERREVRAVLGFEWSFSKHGGPVEFQGPDLLSEDDWNGHLGYLRAHYDDWAFAPGFLQDPLRP
jgi:hypothetical protein